MKTLKFTIEYVGTRYHGWQRQENTPMTIQQVLEENLERILQKPVRLEGAGRTDAGVHAKGQVASARIDFDMPSDDLRKRLNAISPRDLCVRRIEEAPSDFHARFSAKGKRYRYSIWTEPVRNIWEEGRYWHVWGGLDPDRMREGARHLVGTHDFRAFAKHAEKREDCVRTVRRVEFVEDPPWIFLEVEGNGFLYGMVRTMMGTLAEAGRGKRSVESVREILDSGDRRRAGPAAPPRGLCLMEVFY